MVDILMKFHANIMEITGNEIFEDIYTNIHVKFEDIDLAFKTYRNYKYLFGDTIFNIVYYIENGKLQYITERKDIDTITSFHLDFYKIIIEQLIKQSCKKIKHNNWQFYYENDSLFNLSSLYIDKKSIIKYKQLPYLNEYFTNIININTYNNIDKHVIITKSRDIIIYK